MTYPVLFLDIDGVLHPEDAAYLSYTGGPNKNEREVKGRSLFCHLPLFLAAIKDRPGLKVILHSSWRKVWDTDDEVYDNLPADLVKVLDGMTDRKILHRYESLLDYVKRHSIEKYIILDDFWDEFLTDPRNPKSICPELVVCYGTRGIGEERVYKILHDKLDEIAPRVPSEPEVETSTEKE